VTTYELIKPVDGQTDSVQRYGLWIPLMFVWLLMLLTFSAPGREGPSSVESLDAIALIKVAVRISAVFVLGIGIARLWHHPRRRALSWCLFPWGLYVGWAIVSTFWSPLKSVSLGQALGLMVQVMLAFVFALRCTDLGSVSKVLYHLSMALLAYNAGALTMFTISPEMSGLTRGIMEGTHWGIYHPTAVGATSSLGIIILIGARLLLGWRWTRAWLAPGLLVHTGLLLLAASRMAIALGVGTVLLIFLLFSRRSIVSGVVAAVCIATAGYIAFDPGLELVGRSFGAGLKYLMRGETSEQLRTVTGRTDLWEMIWDEFKKSPLIGHGYFVSSERGELDVWDAPSNKTAHNILLQVLVSTGVIGAILFLWALIQPLATCGKALWIDPQSRNLAAFLGLFGIWYFGWGLFCESFMGPVQPESVVFFTLLGMAVGVFSSDGQTR
jgi:O-antigen ligase